VLTVTSLPKGYINVNIPHCHNEFITLSTNTLTRYRHVPSAPVVETTAMGVNGDNFVITWNSEPGANYQVQASTNLADWADTGVSLTGTGDTMTWANAISNAASYYRLITH
jgi:hypothetical protein